MTCAELHKWMQGGAIAKLDEWPILEMLAHVHACSDCRKVMNEAADRVERTAPPERKEFLGQLADRVAARAIREGEGK